MEVIRELQKHYPIKRAPMRLRLTIPGEQNFSILEKLKEWNAGVISRDEAGSQLSIICEMEPNLFRDCDALIRNLQGRLEILAVNVHVEGDTFVDQYDDHEDESSSLKEKMQKHTISSDNEYIRGEIKQNRSAKSGSSEGEVKLNKCSTCNAVVGDSKEFREHFKSDWHKHNLRRKTRQLPPLTAEECMADMELGDSKADLKEYSF
nr:ribosome maturation protein SBDS [Ipomoea batatas]